MTRAPSRPVLEVKGGLARCMHFEDYGLTCDTCFHSRPYLARIAGVTYRLAGDEWTDGEGLLDTLEEAFLSRETPEVEVVTLAEVRAGDRLLGFTPSPQSPLIVGRVISATADRLEFIKAPGTRSAITGKLVAREVASSSSP